MSSGKILHNEEFGHVSYLPQAYTLPDFDDDDVTVTMNVRGPVVMITAKDQTTTPSTNFDLVVAGAQKGDLVLIQNNEGTTDLSVTPGTSLTVSAGKAALFVCTGTSLVKLCQQADPS